MRNFSIILTLLLIVTLIGESGCSCISGEYHGAAGDTDKLEMTHHYLLATVNAKSVVHFAVTNISEQRINKATVEISYYNKDGEVIGSGNTTIEDLGPGEISDLTRVTSSFDRLEVKGYGFILSVESYGGK